MGNGDAADELWALTFDEQNEWRDRFSEVPFDNNGGQWGLRYYSYIAVNAVLEAIAAGVLRNVGRAPDWQASQP